MKLKSAITEILIATITNAILSNASFRDLALSILILNLALGISRKKKRKRNKQELKEK